MPAPVVAEQVTASGVHPVSRAGNRCKAWANSRLARSAALNVIAVGLVDGEQVGHLDDSALDSLEFVAGAGDHEQQKKIDHAVNQRLRLAHAHGFDEHGMKARSLAEDHGFAGATGNAAERAARGRRAYERHFAVGEPLHAGFVAEDAAARAFAAGIDGEHRDAVPLADQVISQRLDELLLPAPGTPVMPTRMESPARGRQASMIC